LKEKASARLRVAPPCPLRLWLPHRAARARNSPEGAGRAAFRDRQRRHQLRSSRTRTTAETQRASTSGWSPGATGRPRTPNKSGGPAAADEAVPIAASEQSAVLQRPTTSG